MENHQRSDTMARPIEHAALEELVPHSGRMFLLDRFVDWNFEDESFTAEAAVTPENPFYDEERSGIPVWVAFEYMAQGIAAFSGLEHQADGEGPKIGFVMAVREFTPGISLFPMGSRVTITARKLMRDGQVVSFSCVASCEGRETTAIINAFETGMDP